MFRQKAFTCNLYIYSITIRIIVEMKKEEKRPTIISIFYIFLQLISGIRLVQILQMGDGYSGNSPE